MGTLLKNRTLLALTLSHFTCDVYSGSIPVLLLLASRSLGFSLADAGLVSIVYGVSSSLTQPLAKNDRFYPRDHGLKISLLFSTSPSSGRISFLNSFSSGSFIN